MRILWSIHLYPPHHNCGSEWMAHNMNMWLLSQGHEVRVIHHTAKDRRIRTPYSIDGVEVFAAANNLDQYRWADVILTQLDFTKKSIQVASMSKKPLVHIVHNDIERDSIRNAHHNNYVVYNSKWIKDKLNYPWPSCVLPPPCDIEYYNVCSDPVFNEYITLISLNENKGGEIFYKIAQALPGKKFLGVKGSYHEQIVKKLPNVTLINNTPDIRQVYKQTRILLMPSAYESWGRTATEAMINGIPVICTTTPGLVENCAQAGLYIEDRNNIEEWVRVIKSLDDEKNYMEASNRVRERSLELDPWEHLINFEEFLTTCKFT